MMTTTTAATRQQAREHLASAALCSSSIRFNRLSKTRSPQPEGGGETLQVAILACCYRLLELFLIDYTSIGVISSARAWTIDAIIASTNT